MSGGIGEEAVSGRARTSVSHVFDEVRLDHNDPSGSATVVRVYGCLPGLGGWNHLVIFTLDDEQRHAPGALSHLCPRLTGRMGRRRGIGTIGIHWFKPYSPPATEVTVANTSGYVAARITAVPAPEEAPTTCNRRR
jgi:hypothetical protein